MRNVIRLDYAIPFGAAAAPRAKTLLVLLFTLASAEGTTILDEPFDYPDGLLQGKGSWTTVGTSSAIPVSDGAIELSMGSGTRQDAYHTFPTISSGTAYAGFDFSVSAATVYDSAANMQPFAHFNTDGIVSRVFVTTRGGAGDYRIGITTSSSTPTETWATDLTFDQTYRAVIAYDVSQGRSFLWINPASESDTKLTGNIFFRGSVDRIAFSQNDTWEDEAITVDNLLVGDSFGDALGVPEPSILLLALGGLVWVRRRR